MVATEREKFSYVPVDPDTRTLKEEMTAIDNLQVLHQYWRWEGITAESVIFLGSDVEGISDDDLQEMVKRHFRVEDDFAGKKNQLVLRQFSSQLLN